MKNLILHAGLHKTGSTSIQHSLSANSELLNGHNMEYLDINNIDGSKIVNHSIVFYSLFCKQPEKYHVNISRNWNAQIVNKHYAQQLEKYINKKTSKNIIISGEDISSLKESELRHMRNYFSEYKIRVIVFIRDPYFSLCSKLQALIKKGTFVELENISAYAGNPQMPAAAIGRMKKVFPDIEFYSFESSKMEGGPVKFFLKLLGIKNKRDFIEKKMNESISNKLTRLGEFINRFEPRFIDNKPNPARKDFYLQTLEFSDKKFLLTQNEHIDIKEILDKERNEIDEISGIKFDIEPEYSEVSSLTSDEIETLRKKSSKLDLKIKALIEEYIRKTSTI